MVFSIALPALLFTLFTPQAGGSVPSALLIIAYGEICHQKQESSLRWDGVPFPICARCAGVYAGTAAAFLFLLIYGSRRGERRMRAFFIGASILMTVDVIMAHLGIYEPLLQLKLATGIAWGFSAGLLIEKVGFEAVREIIEGGWSNE